MNGPAAEPDGLPLSVLGGDKTENLAIDLRCEDINPAGVLRSTPCQTLNARPFIPHVLRDL